MRATFPPLGLCSNNFTALLQTGKPAWPTRPLILQDRAAPRRIVTLSLCFLTFCVICLPAHAEDAPAPSSGQCEKLAEQVANQVGGTIEGHSSRINGVPVKVTNASELRVICLPDPKRPQIFIKSNLAYPHASFYKVLADAGHALSGLSLRRLNKAAHNCHRAAAGAADGRSNKGVRGLYFECRTSIKDNTSIFLFRRKFEHRP